MNENTIIGTVPAASELHKVPGFDPMKHLQRTVNAQGEPVMRLKPNYQRLWFRLACPKGRMLLNPLRITDQLAIFEAKIFFHRDDPTPASSFTSNKSVQETSNYIQAAQDEALKEALDNAGFGIQLCDVTQAPSDAAPNVSAAPTVQTDVAVKQPAPSPVQKQETPVVEEPAPIDLPTAQEVEPEPVKNMPVQDAPDTVPQKNQPEQAASYEGQQSVLTMLNFSAPVEKSESSQETAVKVTTPDAPADTADLKPEEVPVQAAPSYSDDTPVEEILQIMTLEEAQSVIAPNGTCTGWTMGQVAERRPSSLRFFLTSFCKCSNIQKAASTLLIQDIEQKKAG